MSRLARGVSRAQFNERYWVQRAHAGRQYLLSTRGCMNGRGNGANTAHAQPQTLLIG